jgi:DNA-binding CsgD family transcriptional regulator
VLEREAELADLEAVSRDAAGGQGRVVLLEGPAGEGKSTLMAAASERAREAGLTVLSGRGGELERDFPFGVMRQLFEPFFVAVGEARREALLRGAAEPAARALGLEPDAAAGPVEGGPGALHAVYWLTANLVQETPAILAVDDVHWADASSLRALGYIALRIADLPLALIAALRPDEPDAPTKLLDELVWAPDATRLSVRPLGPGSVARIVREHLPDADQATCEAAHKATAGNPLYLRELLRSLPAEGTGENPGSELVARLAIPSLGARVMRRVGRVAPEAQPLARAMAVLGDGSRLASAGELAEIDDAKAGLIAHTLRRIEILADEDPVRFVHPLVRRSVYDSMSITEREAQHRAASEILARAGAPPAAVAMHLGALTPSGSVTVAEGVVAAADMAVAQGATDEAVRWFQRALDEGAPRPAPAGILTGLGLSKAALRDPRAIEPLHRALAETEDPGLRAYIATALADLLVLSGEWAAAMDVTRSFRASLGTDDGDAFAQMAAIELMLAAYSPGLGAGLDLDPRELMHLAEGPGWGSHALAAALAVRAAHRSEDPRQVRRLVDRALADDLLVKDIGAGRWPMANVLIALTDIDEYDRALALSDAVREVARPSGSVTTEILASDHRGWIHARRGDLAAAEADMRPGLAMALAANLTTVIGTQLFYLQDALLERDSLGDIAEVAQTLDPGPGVEGTWAAGALAMARGRLRMQKRDQERGLDDLRHTVELARTLRMGPTVWPIRSVLALALPRSERDEALALVDEELDLARATGLPRPEGVALRAAGALAAGNGEGDAIELLGESVAVLERSPARLEHARSLVALGAALRRAGQRADAREPLSAGLGLARAGGAQRLARHAADELRAAGGRRSARLGTGRDALTASELRVAQLAANGASNPEIAQELFVSLKTVETHLSHAYAKLDLSGRGARRHLAQALEADQP